MRLALATAATSGRLTHAEWSVLGAAIALVPAFSKLEDDVFLDQIAERAHVTRSTASRALKRLDELEILIYRGQRGPGRAPLITFPEPPESCAHEDNSRVAQDGSSVAQPTGEELRAYAQTPEKTEEESL